MSGRTLPVRLGAQEPELAEAPDRGGDRVRCRGAVDVERADQFLDDLEGRMRPVTTPPHERGGDIEVMHLVHDAIQDDDLLPDAPGAEIMPSSRAIVGHRRR